MKKAAMVMWAYTWAYLFIVLGLLDRIGDWMVRQIDTNNYLVGALFMWLVFSAAWMAGIIQFGG